MRIAQIDIATGTIKGIWLGDEANPPIAPIGIRFITLADNQDVTGKLWNGSTFENGPASRIISQRAFMRRFTTAEKVGIEAIAETATTTGRRVRVLMRELSIGNTVDLTHADVATGLSFLKTVLVASGVWADDSVSDIRIF